jgi:hypothetical protein
MKAIADYFGVHYATVSRAGRDREGRGREMIETASQDLTVCRNRLINLRV